MFTAITTNSQKSYQLHRQVAVDEAMVLFKGQSSLKQYMPMKPIKRGYKCWCLCDSTNGYMYNVDVYQGASGNLEEDGLGSTVVQKMIQPLHNKKHYVYMDNFFTSVQLAKKLRHLNTYMIGTTRTNRRAWPSSLKNIKALCKAMRRG